MNFQLHLRSLTAHPWKMVGLEDDPFLLGPGNWGGVVFFQDSLGPCCFFFQMMKLELEHSKKRPFSRNIPTQSWGVKCQTRQITGEKHIGHMSFFADSPFDLGKILWENLRIFWLNFDQSSRFSWRTCLYLSLFLICLAKKYIDTYTRYTYIQWFLFQNALTRFLFG